MSRTRLLRNTIVLCSLSLLCASTSFAQAPSIWNRLFPGGSFPLGRFGFPAILDVPRDRLVFVGGWGGAYFADTWAVNLGGPPVWTNLTAGVRPNERLEHTSIFDPVRQRMWIFGGKDAFQWFDDVWSFDLAGPPVWTQATTTPGPTRRESRAIYDPVGDRMLLLMGYGELTANPSVRDHMNEVWALDLAAATPAWTMLAPVGTPPPPRRGHTAVYDAANRRVLVFGGANFQYAYGNDNFLDDTWSLDLTTSPPTWSRLLPAGTLPHARYGHAAVFDAARNRMVMFGGFYNVTEAHPGVQVFLNDAWELTLSGVPRWKPLTTSGGPPSPRDFPGYIADPLRDRMLVLGGNNGVVNSQLWELVYAANVTPALGGLVSFDATSERVRLLWELGGAAGAATLERLTEETQEWRAIASLLADGSGRAEYEDSDVLAGHRYDYRLAFAGREGTVHGPQVTVIVPMQASFALWAAWADPAGDGIVVDYALPDAAAARLEAFDLSGRRLASLDVGTVGAGRHRSTLSARMPSGVCFIRLARAGATATRRVALLR